jgi:hypothetical protein
MLSGCAIFQSGTETANQKAVDIGNEVGTLACLGVELKAPGHRAQIEDALTRGEQVIGSPDFTMEALKQALSQVQDQDTRLFVLGGVALLKSVLRANDISIENVAPDSPLVAGLGGLFKGCRAALPEVPV